MTCYRRRLRTELEVARGEILESALVAEKDHLAVDLTTQLQAVGDLFHLGLADALATHVDLTLAVRTTNSDATFFRC